METLTLSNEMIWVLVILAFTIYLFVSEVVAVDVAAISIMVLLGLTNLVGPWLGLEQGLVPATQLFNGFASNAVISIIAVMIIGAGLDKTGVMGKLAGFILKAGGSTEKRIIPIISGTVGFISSFMQNVGAAALFLPVVSRISSRTGLPMSRLLMPMGFCAILGGTVTMIGSSPLILLNDLILTSNKALPAGVEPMQTYNLFAVTPIGIVLVLTGIVYFVLAGRFVLPTVKSETGSAGATMKYFEDLYGLEGSMYELRIPDDSPLVGMEVGDLEQRYNVPSILALHNVNEEVRVAPPRDIRITGGALLAVMGPDEQVEEFAREYGLKLRPELEEFVEAMNPTRAGIAEVVIPPGSRLIGQTLAELRMRKTFGLSVLAVFRQHEVIRGILRNLTLEAGDTLVVHTRWSDLIPVSKDRNFVVATDFPREELRPHKVVPAMVFFLIALSLVLFTDLRLSVALLTGALGMIISGVLKIEEAYEAVSWKTVFLLASLIPLGLAVETTGTAAWIAQKVLSVMEGVPVWGLQAAIAALATFFTLVMSNVGATVLLVPLAVNIALGAGANPALFALTVAISTSNSFLIPTHQVNALIMGPAGYRVKDFMRAGGVMTVLFLVVEMVMLNIVF